jgi:hypothetical protein
MENTSEEEKQKRIEEYAKAYCRNNVDYKGEEYDRIRHSFSLH